MNGQHKRAQTVAYEVGESLYINVTNKCSNRCDFCIRNNGDGAYGSEPLWLEREPGAEEILAAIAEKGADRYPSRDRFLRIRRANVQARHYKRGSIKA